MDHSIIFEQLYQDFNNRNVDAVLDHFYKNVTWPNGWEGGYVHGHEQVRAYWLRQWQEIAPSVFPQSYEILSDKKVLVKVRQLIKNLEGEVLSDGQVVHLYTMEEGLITGMEIVDL